MRALLMLLIACGGGAEPVPSPAPPPTPIIAPPPPTVVAPACEPVIKNAAARIATESRRTLLPTAIDRTAAVMIASCELEAWPASVLTCIATARLDADLDGCTEELTYRQHQRLRAKIARVLPPPAPRAPPRIAVPPRSPFARPIAPSDCATLIRRTTPACIAQYCSAHPTEPRCMVE